MKKGPTTNTPYNGGTAEFISFMKDAAFEERIKLWNQVVLKEGKELRMEFCKDEKGNQKIILRHVSGLERISSIIVTRRDEMKSQGVPYGVYDRQYLNRSSSQIGNILHGVTCPRDIAINGILMMKKPLTVAEADHALMEMEMPGLFVDTYLARENIRNYILKQLLEHISHVSAPQEDGHWLKLAWNIMDYLGLPPLGSGGDGGNLSDEARALADGWYEEAKALGKTNYMKLRKAYLERYKKEYGKSIRDLAEATGINTQTCRDILYTKDDPTDGRRGNHGERNSLICICACLGCTLDETNRILREANYALLYPPVELVGTGLQFPQLLQNEVERASSDGDVKIYDPCENAGKAPPEATGAATAAYIIEPKQ